MSKFITISMSHSHCELSAAASSSAAGVTAAAPLIVAMHAAFKFSTWSGSLEELALQG